MAPSASVVPGFWMEEVYAFGAPLDGMIATSACAPVIAELRLLLGLIAHATHLSVPEIPVCLNAMSNFPVLWLKFQWRYEDR